MRVENMKQYVFDQLAKGVNPRFYKKFARVEAEQGVPGQKITTIMKDGHVEVSDVVVKVDENGNPDWIVTNPTGEKYAVPHKKFVKRYDIEAGKDGKHAPKGSAIEAIQIDEEISFDVPWGENGAPVEMTIKKGGYLNITDLGDIYGIQEEEFKKTYARCNKEGIFEDKNLRIAFEQKDDIEAE